MFYSKTSNDIDYVINIINDVIDACEDKPEAPVIHVNDLYTILETLEFLKEELYGNRNQRI